MGNTDSSVPGAVVQPTAVLLGAGFSKWAINLPVARDLFDFRIHALSEPERKRLRQLRLDHVAWNEKHPGNEAEKFVGHMLRKGDRSARRVLWYITRRLSEPFFTVYPGGRQTLMIDDYQASRLRGVRRVRNFLNGVSWAPLSGIITPNYDLLIEFALGTAGFNYGVRGEVLYGRGKNYLFPWQGAWPFLNGYLPVAKIHGSVSWDDKFRYTDGRAGFNGRALIVPPYPGKPRSASLQKVWELAESILKEASRVLVFGFGFNRYDKILLKLLQRGGKGVQSVLVVDIKADVEAARRLWPRARIDSCLPPPRGAADLRSWIRQVNAKRPE